MRSQVVTSLTNPTVKAVRALHLRRERSESGRFLVEGLRSVIEAVELGRRPRLVLHGPGLADHPLVRRATAAADSALEVTPEILAKISRRDNPQTVLGVFDQVLTPLDSLAPASARCWVALEAIRDPGNLGTILRTADAAACGGVILVGDCCDPFSVEAVRASMGSLFAVPIARAETAAFLAWRRAWPGAVVGTHLDAACDFRDAGYSAPTLLVMGNEQAGMTSELAAACDVTVKIPMLGRADSLNLAIATALMIYQVVAPGSGRTAGA